jgi:hypothetical protein
MFSPWISFVCHHTKYHTWNSIIILTYPIQVMQLKRRETWPDLPTARSYFASRPLYASFDPRVFESWMKFGLVIEEVMQMLFIYTTSHRVFLCACISMHACMYVCKYMFECVYVSDPPLSSDRSFVADASASRGCILCGPQRFMGQIDEDSNPDIHSCGRAKSPLWPQHATSFCCLLPTHAVQSTASCIRGPLLATGESK